MSEGLLQGMKPANVHLELEVNPFLGEPSQHLDSHHNIWRAIFLLLRLEIIKSQQNLPHSWHSSLLRPDLELQRLVTVDPEN